MATKAERFQEEQRQARPKKAKKATKAKRATVLPHTTSFHNDAVRVSKNATYAHELSATTSSRKSTRKSKNRQKTDASLRYTGEYQQNHAHQVK